MLRLHNAVQIAEKMVAQGDFFSQNVSSCKIPSGQVRAVQFSDAIVAITRDASPACSLLIQLASQVFFLHGLKNGVAIRGALSRGLVTADFEHSIFFGQPIIDAYRLGESQCWYGVALHPTAEESQETNVGLLGEDEIPVVESFAVPTKTEEEPEELSVINWPVFAESRDDLVELLQPFDGRDSPEAGKLLKYHERTLSFAEKMWSKYRG